jgi:hypothetical protein
LTAEWRVVLAGLPPGDRPGGERQSRGGEGHPPHSYSSRCCLTPMSRSSTSPRLVGHSSTATTETIYRKQIRPVIIQGADVMDRIFPQEPGDA